MVQKQKLKISKTSDNRVYKLLQRSKVLGCPICGPNSGCNSSSRRGVLDRNWKKFRKTQWKE